MFSLPMAAWNRYADEHGCLSLWEALRDVHTWQVIGTYALYGFIPFLAAGIGVAAVALGGLPVWAGLLVTGGLAVLLTAELNRETGEKWYTGTGLTTILAIGAFSAWGARQFETGDKPAPAAAPPEGAGTATGGAGQSYSISSLGYKPGPGERTLEGFVRNNVSAAEELSLYTDPPSFANNPRWGTGGQFKRFGLRSHAGLSPHVHQPFREVNLETGQVFAKLGTKRSNGGVTSPSRRDVKQLYDYLFNGKYRP